MRLKASLIMTLIKVLLVHLLSLNVIGFNGKSYKS